MTKAAASGPGGREARGAGGHWGVDFGDTRTSPWFALIPRRHLPSLPYHLEVIFTWLARNAGRANAYYRFPEERGRNRPASGVLTAGMCSVDG
jgi:hypothetical protein